MKSMTGQGISRLNLSEKVTIEVILQSYNSKNFEARLQIPAFYNALENMIRKELKTKFVRGSLSLVITRIPLYPPKISHLKWNKKEALKWKALYGEMAKALKIKNDVSLFNISNQLGVLELLSQNTLISQTEKAQVKTLVRKAILICDKERQREGIALRKDFFKNLKALTLNLKQIQNLSNLAARRAKKQIEQKLKSINLLEQEDKIKNEIIGTLIQKMDVCEEVSRMQEHLKVFGGLISSAGVIGKKMTFYLQEMIRELNTIGSKSQDFKLSQAVIQAKTTVERMREQVQNVE